MCQAASASPLAPLLLFCPNYNGDSPKDLVFAFTFPGNRTSRVLQAGSGTNALRCCLGRHRGSGPELKHRAYLPSPTVSKRLAVRKPPREDFRHLFSRKVRSGWGRGHENESSACGRRFRADYAATRFRAAYAPLGNWSGANAGLKSPCAKRDAPRKKVTTGAARPKVMIWGCFGGADVRLETD